MKCWKSVIAPVQARDHFFSKTQRWDITFVYFHYSHKPSTVTSTAKQQIEEALKQNPKLKMVQQANGTYKFSFRPPLDGVKDKKSFYKYLERHHYEGLGGVMKEEVVESLPKAEKILKYHEEKKNIILHTRPDKKVCKCHHRGCLFHRIKYFGDTLI